MMQIIIIPINLFRFTLNMQFSFFLNHLTSGGSGPSPSFNQIKSKTMTEIVNLLVAPVFVFVNRRHVLFSPGQSTFQRLGAEPA